jgi:ribosomal protein L6P/L9E
MPPRSLWGELPDSTDEKPPVTILKEQAEVLSQITNGILHGRVTRESVDKGFTFTLDIVAPYLDYTFEVLEAEHGIEFYPVKLRAGERRLVDRKIEEPTRITCKTEEELVEGLAQILSSPRVRKVIAALLAQSKA